MALYKKRGSKSAAKSKGRSRKNLKARKRGPARKSRRPR